MQQSKPRWKRFKFKVGFAKRVVDFVAGAHRLRREQHVWRDLQVVCSQHGAVEDGRAGELGRQNTGQEGNVATFCLSLSNSTYFLKGMSSMFSACFFFSPMQIAGLISAVMAMIVTLALGFLLEPLPRVRLNSIMNLDLPYPRFPGLKG